VVQGSPKYPKRGGKPAEIKLGEAEAQSPKEQAKKKNKKAKAKAKDSSTQPTVGGASQAKEEAKVTWYAYEMFGHVEQTVDRYIELSGKSKDSLKMVATPCIDDHMIPPEEFQVKGELSPIAARVVLKALYVARIARLDVMWAVNMLAREVTRWNAACDWRLHRLISFLHHTKFHAQMCYVGDSPSQCKLMLFRDASFAGDLRDSKSTSGCILCLVGPNTFVPLT